MGKRNSNPCRPPRESKSKLVFKGEEGEEDGVPQRGKSKLKLKPSMKEETAALEGCLEKLFEKSGSTREKALSSIIQGFTNNVQHRFVNNNCITLLHRCLNSIRQGSARERYLAFHVIGLLSITVGCVDGLAHEILEDSVTLLSQALQSASEPLKLLDCLAIISFVGGNNVGETERSMQIIWQFIHQELDPQVTATEHTSEVRAAAISAWSFLLATMDSWSVNSKLWRESMSYFSNLLHNGNLSLRMAAGEAMGIIFEMGNLPKFFNETKTSSGSSSHEENDVHPSMEEIKDAILNRVTTLSMKAGDDDSTEKGLIKSHRTLFCDVLRLIKGCYSSETGIKIGGDMLKLSTWSQLVQVNYLKRFLGAGFVKHAQDNKVLHDFLDFTPKRKACIGVKEHISSDEKVNIHYVYQRSPRAVDDLSKKKMQEKLYSSNSVINKAKSQLLNKKRMLSQAKKEGYFAVGLAYEDA